MFLESHSTCHCVRIIITENALYDKLEEIDIVRQKTVKTVTGTPSVTN